MTIRVPSRLAARGAVLILCFVGIGQEPSLAQQTGLSFLGMDPDAVATPAPTPTSTPKPTPTATPAPTSTPTATPEPTSAPRGTKVLGKVTSAIDKTATITVPPSTPAQAGDVVTVSFKIPGLDEPVEVGTGKVKYISGTRVTAQFDQIEGYLEAGQDAEIACTGTAQTNNSGAKITEATPTPQLTWPADNKTSPKPPPPPPVLGSSSAAASQTPYVCATPPPDDMMKISYLPGPMYVGGKNMENITRMGQRLYSKTTPSILSGNIIFTDTFSRGRNRQSCNLGEPNNEYGGVEGFNYLPIFPGGDGKPAAVIISDNNLANGTLDFGGVQFTNSETPCAGNARGANMGQNIMFQIRVRFTSASSGITYAGPYFRSRAAAPGDGIIGGSSAGYWVRLASTGAVDVVGLNPYRILAT
ncbi:MAG: hypothetical protein K1X53_16370, partial [Candidatus Sumerlaeaceae bacterium]|nr:hypothetical protein [Candidatus Sumerlaeaceae bacterium]